MGHYAASTFTSHIRIPFDYSALLHLQQKMIERMDSCLPDLDRFNFNPNEYNRATRNSTFELYKSSKDTAANNKFHNFTHQTSDFYNLETSFIHRPEEQTVILILHVPFVEAENLLPLYEFISPPIYFNFTSNVSVIPDV
jgi:hypothetical protein